MSGLRSSSSYSHVVPARGAPPMMKSGSLNVNVIGQGVSSNGSLDDVEGTAARLVENPPEVFAEDTDHHELHAAEQEHRQHHRRPAHHTRAVQDLVQQHVDAE